MLPDLTNFLLIDIELPCFGKLRIKINQANPLPHPSPAFAVLQVVYGNACLSHQWEYPVTLVPVNTIQLQPAAAISDSLQVYTSIYLIVSITYILKILSNSVYKWHGGG